MVTEILLLLALSIFFYILYKRKVKNQELGVIEKINDTYFKLDRKNRKKDYIRVVSTRPADNEKIIFENIIILAIVFSTMYLLLSKSIFFAAVVSDSMIPTFHRNDLILIQNIDRRFNVEDIVMFKRPDTSIPVTHRIKSIKDGLIRTAGDNSGQLDWWELKNEDMLGKAIMIEGKPILIKGLGVYFITENKNQRIGPFDYRTYIIFIEVVKLYGYIIAAVSILAYLILEGKRVRKVRELEKRKKLKIF